MKQIKIREDIAKLIISGKEKYLFEELAKGLVAGTYAFTVEKQVSWKEICGCENCGMCKQEHHLRDVIAFTAKLTPIDINPNLVESTLLKGKKNKQYWLANKGVNKERLDIAKPQIENDIWYLEQIATKINKLSYDFVKENFKDWKIDFVAYETSDVKESE